MSDQSDKNSTSSNAQAGGSQSIPVSPLRFEAIKPTEVPLTRTGGGKTDGGSTQTSARDFFNKNLPLFIFLPIALVILLAVVFVLPRFIDVQETKTATTTDTIEDIQPATQAPSGPVESPWTDAQFAKQRRETQDILAKLLDRQKTLESIHVERWAADTFASTKETAAKADTLYREQNFQQAQRLYQQALEQFDQLIADSEKLFSENLENGFNSIEEGNAEAAAQQFELATLIHPESTEAQIGLARAKVLDQVLELLRQASRYQRQNQLDQAKDNVLQALQVDQDSNAAKSKLAEINSAITERNYGKSMSLGFAAITQNQFDQAIQHFQQALKIKPGAADAKAAIVQAQNQQTQQNLQRYISDAIAAENNEQWQVAVDNYDRALRLDSNLVQAKVGKIKAQIRADLDAKLTDILENPERLTAEAVFVEYQQIGREVRDMPERGPRLQQQFEQLERAMRRSITPVEVVLQSDNLTDVTLYQVGTLGKFEQHQVTLKPGKYTAVGTRIGYRDVRKEFTVSANTENSPIVIQCEEPINNG